MHSEEKKKLGQNIEKLQSIVGEFSSAPFLFIGSGVSRRYLKAPSWEELLVIFAKKIRPTYSYQYYESRAKEKCEKRGIDYYKNNAELYPLIASLIRLDFNKRWFDDLSFHTSDPEVEKAVEENHADPFHAEVAAFFRTLNVTDPTYDDEIAIFKDICVDRIAGIITTNYDCLLDKLTGFQTFIGQQGILSTTVQGIGEIYKIHGSATSPSSIVLDEEDYNRFKERMLCLSAKLITIFIENPIIFIGYSLNDSNIKGILASIIECLEPSDLERLQKRLFFVEYTEESIVSIEPQTYSLQSSSAPLRMTNIKINDFSLLYSALKSYKPRFPVKKLRMLKAAFVEFIATNNPSERVKVASIDSEDVSDYDLGLYIGKTVEIDSLGYKSIKANEVYKDIVLDTCTFNPMRLICETFPDISKTSNHALQPIFKYLSQIEWDTSVIPLDVNYAKEYDDLITSSTKKYRDSAATPKHRSVRGIVDDYPPEFFSEAVNPEISSIRTQCRLMEYLYEGEIVLSDLENFLQSIFLKYPDILNLPLKDVIPEQKQLRSYLKKLIKIYDYIKYNKKSHE